MKKILILDFIILLNGALLYPGTWEGFQAPEKFFAGSPVVCFAIPAGSSYLSGIAAGTNGGGVKIFTEFNNGIFLKEAELSNGFTVSLAVNYFNNDTLPDIAVPSYFGGSFSIFSGNSEGGFTSGESYSVEGHCTWIAAADFNEDGNIDLAAGHNGSGQPFHLYVYLGNGDGTFTRFQKYPTQFATPTEIIAADVNNDAHIDISYSLSGPDCGMLFLGNGDGTFKVPERIANYGLNDVRGNSQGFTLADINTDGNIDWIGAQDETDSIIVRYGDGTGKFVQGKSLYMPHTWDAEAADLNNDGRIDIAASNLDSVLCFLQDESENFVPSAAVHAANGAVRLLLTDIDKDGFTDLIMSNLDSSFSVSINKGNLAAGIEKTDYYPNEEILYQNYPNPFNSSTTIKYFLPFDSRIELIIYSILGEKVKEVFSSEAAGYHQINFNAGNLSSGIYFYTLSAEPADTKKELTGRKKLIFLK